MVLTLCANPPMESFKVSYLSRTDHQNGQKEISQSRSGTA